MGMMLGTGGQSDYGELSTTGAGTVAFRLEVGDTTSTILSKSVAMPGHDAVDLILRVDPAAGTVLARFAVESGGVVGPNRNLGNIVLVPRSWFSSAPVAIGIISTSHGTGAPFPATWDYLRAS